MSSEIFQYENSIDLYIIYNIFIYFCFKSVIIPIYNGEKWIDKCFESILNQELFPKNHLEVSVCNDCSTDGTEGLLTKWKDKFSSQDIMLTISHNKSKTPCGGKKYLQDYGPMYFKDINQIFLFFLKHVGFSKNRAVEQSCGQYLCFQDVDDVMHPLRITLQYEAAKTRQNSIIGSKFIREPIDSTVRFTRWANELSPKQLLSQVYTSHGPTVIMPTWFYHRSVFLKVGGFSEDGKGTPEDLIFFYRHLDLGGNVFRVDKTLLTYRYHASNATFSISEDSIWALRINRLQKEILSNWISFTIWNAGKQGRQLYRSLDPLFQERVLSFCDVDDKKVGKYYSHFDEKSKTFGRKIPIVHFSNAKPPFIICVKLDLSKGMFEENLRSLNLEEMKDYIHFN